MCVCVLHLCEAKSQIAEQTEPPHLILMLILFKFILNVNRSVILGVQLGQTLIQSFYSGSLLAPG